MPQKNSCSVKSQLLILLLEFVCFWKLGETQVTVGETNISPDGEDGGAFFALRSCHQLLTTDTGEFFSPDYLCSNPPLWCNWTIQVDPGKKIHLHLEDLTSDDACHLKQDQIHVDEPAGHFGGHKVLQKCWREAKFTSSSNTLYVVLLISGWPNPPYRGFNGHYQAFGPPVVYNPQEVFTERGRKPPTGHEDFSQVGPVINGEEMESNLSEKDRYDASDELTWDDEEAEDTEVAAVPTVPAPTQRTSRSERGVSLALSRSSDDDYAAPPQRHPVRQNYELKPATHNPAASRRDVEEASAHPDTDDVPEENLQSWSGEEEPAADETRTEVDEASEQIPSPSGEGEPEETEQAHPHPNTVELLSEPRGNSDVRNQSVNPHLPGGHLFEVAVEVDFSQGAEESWDNQARSLLLSVKSLIREQLEALQTPLSMSSKRIKRLNAGVLYILWLQIGQRPGGPQVHRAVHAALQGLIATGISLREDHGKAVIISVSTADVNECGTQLVLCHMNADCVNHFGSYSCHCRPGFMDKSLLGLGGTVCVDAQAAGCSSGLSPETKGVYVLFFLLSSLILTLLVVAGVLYHRHHRGAFLVRCHSSSTISPPDVNNNLHHPHDDGYSCPAESDVSPPPPPARGPRGGWPQGKERCPPVDLPLLRFSSLLPPDSYMEPQEGGKT